MQTNNKIFPLRLAPGFHGAPKTFKKLSFEYKSKTIERQNPQIKNIRLSNWQIKRLDTDVIRQRNQTIVHVCKDSVDVPQWWKSTYKYYKKFQDAPRLKQSAHNNKNYDVFNREKKLNQFKNNSQCQIANSNKKLIKQMQVSAKIGSQFKTKMNFYTNQQVSSKIGSLYTRNFHPKKPQLKIGQDNYIDTYSIF